MAVPGFDLILVNHAINLIFVNNPFDVFAGLRKGHLVKVFQRTIPNAYDEPLSNISPAGIIGSDHQRQPTVEFPVEVGNIPATQSYVNLRISQFGVVKPFDRQPVSRPARGIRHQLHQALSAPVGGGLGAEAAFHLDQGKHQ